MKFYNMNFAILLLILIMSGCVARQQTQPESTTKTAESLYQITPALTDQNNQPRTFDQFRGQPTIIAMFYSSCSYACPILVAKLLSIDSQLNNEARQQIRYMLVSLDADRDTPETLKKMLVNYHLDERRYSLLHAKENDVRLIATLLGVSYRKLANGEFAHNTPLTLVDRHGVVILQSDSQKESVDDILQTMRQQGF